jgi:membrane-associated protease RseP (regulator of RpoE activity)
VHWGIRSAMLFGMLCLLGACAYHTFAPGPGKSAREYEPDAARCRLFARGGTPGFAFEASGSPKFVAASAAGAIIGGAIAGAITTNENYNDCMEANGWRIADDAQSTPVTVPNSGSTGGRVPVYAQPLVASLADAPVAERRALGIRAMAVSYEMTGWLHLDSPKGLLVLDVMPGDAAAAAGIRAQDVLLTFGGTPIMTKEGLSDALASVGSQTTVAAEIWRNGREQPVRLAF